MDFNCRDYNHIYFYDDVTHESIQSMTEQIRIINEYSEGQDLISGMQLKTNKIMFNNTDLSNTALHQDQNHSGFAKLICISIAEITAIIIFTNGPAPAMSAISRRG